MHLVCPPKFCITFFFKFLLDIVVAPEKIEDNANAKVFIYLFITIIIIFFFLGGGDRGANKVNLGDVQMGNTKILFCITDNN